MDDRRYEKYLDNVHKGSFLQQAEKDSQWANPYSSGKAINEDSGGGDSNARNKIRKTDSLF